MSKMWCVASEKKGTLPETNIVPENGGWEDDISFWGPAYFHRAILVSGSFIRVWKVILDLPLVSLHRCG